MNLLLALVLTFQTAVDPLLMRFVGQWSGTKSNDGTWRQFGQSGLMKR